MPEKATYEVISGLQDVDYPPSDTYEYPMINEDYKTFTFGKEKYIMVELQPAEMKSNREFGLFQWIANQDGEQQLVFKRVLK